VLRPRRPAPRDFDSVWESAVRGRYEPYATDNQARSTVLCRAAMVGSVMKYEQRDGKERLQGRFGMERMSELFTWQ
jgi:hypothetical protein